MILDLAVRIGLRSYRNFSRSTVKVYCASQGEGVKGIGNVVKGKLVMLLRRFVLFAQNSGGKFGNVVKEKLVMLFRRFVPIARNVGGNRPNNDVNKRPLKLEWPYVMNSFLVMHRPFVSGTWIWHCQHARWHHRYYRTRR